MNIIFDTIDKTFSLSGSLKATDGIIGLGFVEDGLLPVDLQGVSAFGFSLNGEDVTLPKHGRIVAADIELVHQQYVNGLQPETDYTLDYWVEMLEFGKISGSVLVATPRTNAPFASWAWDSETKTWGPPVARPEGNDTEWDEETESWVPSVFIAKDLLGSTDIIHGARGVDDILDLLIAKGTIAEADLPAPLADRRNKRNSARAII